MKKLISQIGVRRGSDHATFCEDFAIQHETPNYFVGIVFDGCSGGQESHFASALFGKIFRKVLSNDQMINDPERELDLQDMKDVAEYCLTQFYSHVVDIGWQLQLKVNELQSTIVFALYNKQTKNLVIYHFGDGVIVIGDEVIKLENTQYENPNAPSYLVNNTYAKSLKPHDFYEFLSQLREQGVQFEITRENVEGFTLFSDGVSSFKHRSGMQVDDDKIIEFLGRNEWNCENPEVFSRKINLLHAARGQKNGVPFEKTEIVKNADDISMVRVLWIEKQQEDEYDPSANQPEAATSEHQA